MNTRWLPIASWTALALVYEIAVGIVAVQAQDGGLVWGVTLRKCQEAPQAPCVFYGEQKEIEAQFGISNLDLEAVQLPPFAGTVIVRFIRDASTEIGVSLDWSPNRAQRVAGEQMGAPDLATQDLFLGTRDNAHVSFMLRRSDGLAIAPGSYAVTIDMEATLAGSRSASGSRWAGRTARSQTWRFVVRSAETPEDWTNFHRLEATHLLSQKRTQEALPHLQEWLRLSPHNRSVLSNLGRAYFDLDRPADAVRVLEETLPAVLGDPEPRNQQSIVVLLAHSYMLLNDEVNARRVLRLTGQSENAVNATLERLRRR